jgi:hypothetical protein
MREFLWRDDDDTVGAAAMYSLTADPVPRPPLSEYENEVAMKTIEARPDLFSITTPIKVDVLKRLLEDHPNRPFVESVLWSFRNGFWPWAKADDENYPAQWDNSDRPPKGDREREFIRNQFKLEIEKERFSPSFGTDLLPGMFSVPVHAVPKPESENLRLVVDHSDGEFSPTSVNS